jgi:hypothetical protein
LLISAHRGINVPARSVVLTPALLLLLLLLLLPLPPRVAQKVVLRQPQLLLAQAPLPLHPMMRVRRSRSSKLTWRRLRATRAALAQMQRHRRIARSATRA